METFSPARDFVPHPGFHEARQQALSTLPTTAIDPPIRDVIAALNALPHCFTLQCCWGHFLWPGQRDEHNLDPLPDHVEGPIRYRIAYVALCLDGVDAGVRLRDRLTSLCGIDEDYVQFGSPDWFWREHPNSYAVQVEPRRFATRDEAVLEPAEALRVQEVRDELFGRLRGMTAG